MTTTLTRLVWVLAAVLAIAAGVVALTQRSAETPGDQAAPTTPAAPSSTTDPAPHDPTTPATEPARGWAATARAYGNAFTNTTGGHGPWLSRLEQLVSPSLAQGYAQTDVAAVPEGRVDNVTRLGAAPAQGNAHQARITYNTELAVDITIARTDGRWLVTTAVPAGDTTS